MKRQQQRRRGRWLGFLLLAIVLIGSGVGLVITLPQSHLANNDASLNAVMDQGFAARDQLLADDIKALKATEAISGTKVVPDNVLQQTLASIEFDAMAGRWQTAHNEIKQFQAKLTAWQAQANHLARANIQMQSVISAVNLVPVFTSWLVPLPIIMYHKTPANFEQQLQTLQQRGYTAVTLQDVTASFAHRHMLPLKPVVLTFDDGYADQMTAFALLEKYRMKATFYIINGGSTSNWCIGASRRYNDPSQPAGGCGDAYLNWDQIRELDQSGLITIGGHTLDHLDLALQSPAVQRHEIEDSKLGIEQELGHPIHDFAYPSGSYNANSIAIVGQAGYATAVTTDPGTYQDPTRPFTLKRIRDAMILP